MNSARRVVHLFFHSPCFDGAVSAALASDYFEQTLGFQSVTLEGVNYHLREKWLSFEPTRPCAVVDFLYHPAADFWADHHPTTFLTQQVRTDFETKRSAYLVYDNEATSCALLLWKRWGAFLKGREEHYRKLVHWADRIDAARYESVEEAISFASPALQINLVLATSRDEGFSKSLVNLFRTRTLTEIADMPEIRKPFLAAKSLQELGIQRLRESIRTTGDGVVVFDVDETGVLVNRYAPFYFYPEAPYSAGITRTAGMSKITIMRNPWREFPSAPLGQFCASLGGGGHQRVGSIVLRDDKAFDAPVVVQQLLERVRAWNGKRRSIEVQ